MSYRFLVASYTESVFTLEFTPQASGDAKLKVISTTEVGFHPSWITPSSDDPSIFYTGLEQPDGKLLTLEFDRRTGKGKVVGDVSSEGHSPCCILALEDEILVANYMSGTIGIFSKRPGATSLTKSQPALQFGGSGPDSDRQEGSHPHQVYLIDEKGRREVLVPDLGSDRIIRLVKNASGVWESAGEVVFDQKLGGGPRHVIFHDNVLYTLLELTNELTAHTFPPVGSATESPKLLASTSTLLDPPSSPPIAMLASELLIATPSNSYPSTYLYASNRNDPHPDGDTIAIFSPYSSTAPNASLKLVKEVRTGLSHLRGMIFFGDDDRYLIAGGANAGGVKVFERVGGGADLREVAQLPTTVVDLKPTGFAELV